MTLVKICGITEIEHALAALDAGADMLGFVFATSRRQTVPDVAMTMIRRCRDRYPTGERPWLAVGVFTDQPLAFVENTAETCGLDVVQLSGPSADLLVLRTEAGPLRPDASPKRAAEHRSQLYGLHADGEKQAAIGFALSLPVFRTIHLSGDDHTTNPADIAEFLPEMLRALRAQHPDSRLLLDSGGSGTWGGTGRTFDWRSIGPAARDSVVAGGLNPSNVATSIQVMHPWAVDVSSGVETKGRKDVDLIRRFIAAVRRTDNHED